VWQQGLTRTKRFVLSRRASLAAKTGLAAGAAWYAASLLPAPFSDYAYYASLGAVSVIYPAISDSVRQAMRATAAIVTGAVLAGLVQWVSWPNALSVALIIMVATAVGHLQVFGEQRHWVVTAALFVLVFSGDPPQAYMLVYVSLIVLGAVIGVVVNIALLPSVNLTSLNRSIDRMRLELVVQLRRMSSLLGDDDDPDPQDFRATFVALEEDRNYLHNALEETRRSGHGNPRAHRWRESHAELTRRAEGLERIAFLVQDVGSVLQEFQETRYRVLDTHLQTATSAALAALADQLEEPTEAGVGRVEESVRALVEQVEAGEYDDSQGRFLAGLIAVSAQRCLHTLEGLLSIREPTPGKDRRPT
jgi:uncharacterized membrane protein YgaE (UPF0421/DUF939 family)